MRNIDLLTDGAAGRRVDAASLIRRAAFCHPDVVAIDDGIRSVTFAEAADRAERVANALDLLGVPPHATVGILSENRSEYVEADLGIALARRVRVALNARLHLEDHLYVAADASMRVLIHSKAFADVAEGLREEGVLTISFDPPEAGSLDWATVIAEGSGTPVVRLGNVEDPAWITYTSGTTGKPKGVVLSQRAIREVAFNLLLEFGPVAPGDQIVMPQPLSHGAGYFVLPWLLSGGGVYTMAKFDPELVISVGERPEVRVFKCVPAMLPPLLEAADGRLLGYETMVYGAAPIPRPVLEESLERFGPVLAQVYGQSEAPVTITCLQKRDHEGDGDQRFSAGRPFRTVAIEVRDDEGNPLRPGELGEIAVTGSHLMSCYHGLEDATTDVLRDGWIMTKDIGLMDERGFVYLRGRRDEMINSGGFNISPREVEAVLSGYPGVEEVAVLGMPDERWGEAVTAIVKLRTDGVGSSDDMLDFAKPRLGFRCPKTVTFVDEIPKTPYGKVDRQKVVALLASDYEGAAP
jgi:fatty-acyl-CoA synthase